jgi:hypothetical protein
LTNVLILDILDMQMRMPLRILGNLAETEKVGSNPDVIAVYRRHAARAMSEGRWTVAEIFLDRILDVDPRSTEAWLMKGLVSQHCKDDGESALQCFRRVITLGGYDSTHPHVQRARQSMGRLLRTWV